MSAQAAEVLSVKPLGPDSLTWRFGLPRTFLLLVGRALMLQVAHPVIGAGVRDFSIFREDPWGRLERSIASLETQMFGGQQAFEESERLREMHKYIKGTGFHGERYSALNPQAYAWVHLSTFDTMLVAFELIGLSGVRPKHHDRLYAEWRQIGLMLGIKDHHMPATLPEFHAYVDDMVANHLEATPTAYDLMETLALRDVGPPPQLPAPAWNALKPFSRRVLHDFGISTLPDGLRERLGVRTTPVEKARLKLAATAVRTVAPHVPAKMMQYPQGHRAACAAQDYYGSVQA